MEKKLSEEKGREVKNPKLAGRLTGLHINIAGLPEEKGTSEKKEAPPADTSTPADPSQTSPISTADSN